MRFFREVFFSLFLLYIFRTFSPSRTHKVFYQHCGISFYGSKASNHYTLSTVGKDAYNRQGRRRIIQDSVCVSYVCVCVCGHVVSHHTQFDISLTNSFFSFAGESLIVSVVVLVVLVLVLDHATNIYIFIYHDATCQGSVFI